MGPVKGPRSNKGNNTMTGKRVTSWKTVYRSRSGVYHEVVDRYTKDPRTGRHFYPEHQRFMSNYYFHPSTYISGTGSNAVEAMRDAEEAVKVFQMLHKRKKRVGVCHLYTQMMKRSGPIGILPLVQI